MGRHSTVEGQVAGDAASQIAVALLHSHSDADRAGQLAALLTRAGISVVRPGAAEVDGVVVFLSAAGLADPSWLSPTSVSVRLIPIRVGDINAELVPEGLRELNWIDWQPSRIDGTFGYVLAGLLSDPSRRDRARQLSHEAEAWDNSGRRDSLLIADYRRARRMADLLRELETDQLAAPSATIRAFVQRSVAVSRPRHRRRRAWQIAGVLGTVVALLVASVLVPAIKLSGYNNHEAIVTTGNQYLLADLPEWSAANAAALLTNGTPAERTLARGTLLQALNTPWEISSLQYHLPPYSSATFDKGAKAIISLAGTSVLAVVDVRTTRVLWSTHVPGGGYYVSVAPGGSTALALNTGGAILINLITYTWKRLAVGTRFQDGKLGSNGVAVVRLADTHVAELNTKSGSVTDFGAYPVIISVAPETPQGPPSALVQTHIGRIALINLASGRVIASMPGNSSGEIGTVAPDGRHAAVEGDDGQLWTFGAGRRPTATGIALPQILGGLTWAPGRRIVAYSQDQHGEVYYLPRAELLGVICRQNARLEEVTRDYRADIVTCQSAGGTSYWKLPAGPLSARPRGESSARSASTAGLSVTSRGPLIDIRGSGSTATGWFQPLTGSISAVSVSATGAEVVIGDTYGNAGVIDVTTQGSRLVTQWRSPDNAPITAVGWANGPVASTRSGQSWQIPDCGDCGTDTALLHTYRARATGCFTARQFQFMSGRTQAILGLRACNTSW